MKVKFVNPRSIDGVVYKPGVHELPDSMAKHWFFLAQIANGAAFIVEEPKVVGAKKPFVPKLDAEKMAVDMSVDLTGLTEPKKKAKKKAEPKPEPKPEEPTKEE